MRAPARPPQGGLAAGGPPKRASRLRRGAPARRPAAGTRGAVPSPRCARVFGRRSPPSLRAGARRSTRPKFGSEISRGSSIENPAPIGRLDPLNPSPRPCVRRAAGGPRLGLPAASVASGHQQRPARRAAPGTPAAHRWPALALWRKRATSLPPASGACAHACPRVTSALHRPACRAPARGASPLFGAPPLESAPPAFPPGNAVSLRSRGRAAQRPGLLASSARPARHAPCISAPCSWGGRNAPPLCALARAPAAFGRLTPPAPLRGAGARSLRVPRRTKGGCPPGRARAPLQPQRWHARHGRPKRRPERACQRRGAQPPFARRRPLRGLWRAPSPLGGGRFARVGPPRRAAGSPPREERGPARRSLAAPPKASRGAANGRGPRAGFPPQGPLLGVGGSLAVSHRLAPHPQQQPWGLRQGGPPAPGAWPFATPPMLAPPRRGAARAARPAPARPLRAASRGPAAHLAGPSHAAQPAHIAARWPAQRRAVFEKGSKNLETISPALRPQRNAGRSCL